MPQATIASQLLPDVPLKNAGKASGRNKLTLDQLVGKPDQSTAFGKLLAGLGKGRAAQATALLSAAGKQGADTLVDPAADAALALQSLQISPELAAALKKLKRADLQSLPPEIATAFAPHMTQSGTLDAQTLSLLDTLSSGAGLTVSNSPTDLVTFVSDPGLAKALMSLSAKLDLLKQVAQGGDQAAADVTSAFAALLPASVSTTVTAPAIDAKTGQPTTTNITMTIADLDGDGFQALKKLAFADIAPYLTMPRLVHTGGNTVMKVAQGPAFLNDGNDDTATWLGNPATLSPVLQTVQALTGSTGDTSPVPVAGFPAQTNTAAAMETTVQAMMPQTMTPQASPFNHAQLMAALLGLPAQQKTAPQMQTPGMSAQAQSSATADTQTGTIAANAPNTAGLQIQAAAAPNAAAAIHISATTLMPQSTAAPHGFGKELKGLDTSLAAFDATDGNMTGLTDPALQIHADAAQNIAGSTATLTAARTAASGLHPSIHLVSAALQRGMEGAVAGIDRQFTIQLEPANLGRVKITLQFSEDNTIKAKLVAERPETVAMLQKDANTLQRTLHDQGFNLNADSLTFDLGGQGSFQGSMSQNGNSYQNGGNASTDEDGTELATIETVMPIFVDPETGLTHVNVVI